MKTLRALNVLDPALSIFGHHLIEASAGTGKTFAIEHLFSKLISAGVPIEQILIVTFTKAATTELKSRLRANLEKTSVKADFDKARIFTIHGFCYRMLKTFAFQANISLDLKDPDTRDGSFAKRRIIFDFLRAHVDEDSYKPEEILELLKKSGNDVHKLANQLMGLMEKRKQFEGNKTLFRLAQKCSEKFQKKEVFSPDDLLHKMKQCLENRHFVELVQKSFRAVIIDEFQDTDPVQWEIFQTLFSNIETLYLVGDPKQSIYRFRGADIHTYFKAKDFIKNHLCLDTNYRSDPLLIASLNRLFSPPVLASPQAQNHPFKDDKGALHFFVVEAESKRSKTWPPKLVEEESLFPFIAKELSYLHIEEAFPLETMAVLVRDKHQAERLCDYLKNYNLDCQVSRDENIAETLGFCALKDLVSLLVDLNNTGKLRLVMAGPFFNWEHELLKEDQLLEMKRVFYAHAAVFQKEGFAHFIREFTLRDDSFDRLCELILQKEAAAQMTSVDLLMFLNEIEKTELEFKSKPATNEIQVMTMHKSKGLEFDVVFALGVVNRLTKEEEFATVGDKIMAFDPENPMCLQHIQEQDAEKLRQLYVALTRAKKRVYVPLVLDKENKPIKIGCHSPIELLNPDFTQFSHTLLNGAVFNIKPIAKFLEKTETPKQIPKTSPSFVHSFSSLVHAERKEKVETSDLFPAGKETGIILHTLFERIFDENLNIDKWIEKTPLENWKERIVEMINQTLHLPLKDGWSLNDIDRTKVFQEAEFVYPMQNNLLKGSIDLVFQKEGFYYILDWKSNLLSDYTQASMEKEMKEHDYFLQAEIYTAALKKYVNCLFGGAFYVFLRGPAVYHFIPKGEPWSK